ncbi:MAG: S9 family peptidase [Lachnospiraceae bacterium]|nr:S9 family peptidase [Lachnospiraceae bacterium]
MTPIKAADLLHYRTLSALEFSADGIYGVFCVVQPEASGNGYCYNLWVLNTQTGVVKQLTSGNAERSFSFNSSNTLIFPGVRGDVDKKRLAGGKDLTVFYQIGLDGGEAVELFRVPLKGATAKKLNDEVYLITALFDNGRPDFNALSVEELPAAKKRYEEEKDYQVIDELPFWFNAKGFINKKRSRLYLYNIVSKELAPITDPMFDTGMSKYLESRNEIIYSGLQYETLQGQNKGLYSYSLETGKTRCLMESDNYTVINFCIDEQCQRILFVGCPIFQGTGIPGYSLYAVGLEDGAFEAIYTQLPEDYGCRTVSDVRFGTGNAMTVKGDMLYLVTSWDNTSGLSTLDLHTKELCHITPDELGVDFFQIVGDRFFTVGFYDSQLQEIYEISNSDGNFQQLTHFSEECLKGKYVAKPQPVSFINKDHIRIDGFVLLPIDFDPEKKYPGILEIHGGPRNNYSDGFMHEMQVMAGAGNFVFFCNPRGSAARGEAFADIYGCYGSVDYQDIMEFTDVVLEKYPQIDKEQLGVSGGSYGGYMVNWIIGHTDRFKAAASQRSISNWVSYYGVCDIGPRIAARDLKGVNPWDGLDVMWDTSPIKYANRAVTPTLFINADEDYRCWMSEGMQMYTALMVKGVPARMCIFHGENHELSRTGKPRHRIRRLNEINDWLFKYMKEGKRE